MDVVYATATVSVPTPDGAMQLVRGGDHWPADDPIVLAHPGLFNADPRYGLSYSARPPSLDEPPVETATARPGEKRAAVNRA